MKRNERKNKKELEQRGIELEKEIERCREKRRRISDEQRKREQERKREKRRRDNSSNAERRERYAGEKFSFCFNKSNSKALMSCNEKLCQQFCFSLPITVRCLSSCQNNGIAFLPSCVDLQAFPGLFFLDFIE